MILPFSVIVAVEFWVKPRFFVVLGTEQDADVTFGACEVLAAYKLDVASEETEIYTADTPMGSERVC